MGPSLTHAIETCIFSWAFMYRGWRWRISGIATGTSLVSAGVLPTHLSPRVLVGVAGSHHPPDPCPHTQPDARPKFQPHGHHHQKPDRSPIRGP